MVIELQNLFNTEGYELKIDYDLTLNDYEFNSSKPFTSPVKIIGFIKNTAGIVELKAEISFDFKFNCDRCAEQFTRRFQFQIEHTLVNQLYDERNDELLLVEDMKLMLDELVLTDILLYLPTKLLCMDSCKGVCAGCGKNLNREACTCKKEIDPRLEVLRSLLQSNN